MHKLISFFCCNIFLLCFIKWSSAELQYNPSDRVIDTSHGRHYSFGVREDNTTNITGCYYESNNGISGYFDVDKTRSMLTNKGQNNILFETREHWELNQVSNSGWYGLCEVDIRWASNEGPTKWVLTPYNIKGQIGNLSAITYKVNFYNNASLVAEEIRVNEGGSFLNYLTYPQKPANITLCTVSFNNSTVELDMHSKAVISSNAHSREDEEIIDRLSSLGNGLCGFKYTNATNDIDFLLWTLNATEYNNTFYRRSFRSTVTTKTVSTTTTEVELGYRFSVRCGCGYGTNFSDLYNPSGKLVRTQNCIYTGQLVTMEDIGRWTCYVADGYSMETTPFITELVEKVKSEVITWINETSSHVNIGCRLNVNYNTSGIKFCKMITPNREALNLRPFAITDRYSSIGTNYKESVCSMQIKKPLQEDEYGAWQCEMSLGKSSTGRFIEVNKTENIEYPKVLKVVTRLYDTYTVSCRVPYSSDYCTIIPVQFAEINRNETTYEPELGRCSVTVFQTHKSQAGNWTCLFAQKQGMPMDEIKIEVIISGRIKYDRQVLGKLGGITTLLCHSNGMPLNYCQFTNPLGETYHMHNHENSTKLSYYGRGTEYGDCGVTITDTTTKDLGKWVCRVGTIAHYGPQEGSITVF